jgi:hypothetical protein
MRVNPVSLGLVLALFLAVSHVLWAGMVAAGLAQSFLDFIFWAHFLRDPWIVAPFDLERAVILVATTGALGYVGGLIAGAVWNALYHPG